MSKEIVFAAICRSCQRERPQLFTVEALVNLLDDGHAIEAYCAECDEFWPVNLQQRIELCEAVATVCGEGGLLHDQCGT